MKTEFKKLVSLPTTTEGGQQGNLWITKIDQMPIDYNNGVFSFNGKDYKVSDHVLALKSLELKTLNMQSIEELLQLMSEGFVANKQKTGSKETSKPADGHVMTSSEFLAFHAGEQGELKKSITDLLANPLLRQLIGDKNIDLAKKALQFEIQLEGETAARYEQLLTDEQEQANIQLKLEEQGIIASISRKFTENFTLTIIEVINWDEFSKKQLDSTLKELGFDSFDTYKPIYSKKIDK